MAEKQIFDVLLEKDEKTEATAIAIPFDVEKVFGAKRVPVRAIVNGAEHRSTVVRMHGRYIMVVPKSFRDAANIKGGETITVEMEKDAAPRVVEIPEDLQEALQKADLTKAFGKLSYTHQKEHVNAVNEAKKEETRIRRIEKTIEILKEKAV